MSSDATLRYDARRGDSLRLLAAEMRLPLEELRAVNGDLDPDDLLPPGTLVAVPCMPPEVRLRLRRTGPLEASLRTALRVRLRSRALESGVLPVYGTGDDRRVAVRIEARSLWPGARRPWEGLLFVDDPSGDALAGAPVRGYVRGARGGWLAAGRTPAETPPGAAEMARTLERRGLTILRRFSERAGRSEAALAVSLTLDGADFRPAELDAPRARLRVYVTDGVAADTDRTGVAGLLRLLLEARSVVAAGDGPRLDVEREGRLVPPEDLGAARIVERKSAGGASGDSGASGDGAPHVTELLPLPVDGRLDLVASRSGRLDRFVEEDRLVAGFAGGLGVTERIGGLLIAYLRDGPDAEALDELCPERRRVSARHVAREQRRIQMEESRLVLLLESAPDGVRLVEAWHDGARLPVPGAEEPAEGESV